MKLVTCDFCDPKGKHPLKAEDARRTVIDGREFDICRGCKAEMDSKLTGKGEIVVKTEYIPYPVPYPVYPQPWRSPFWSIEPSWVTVTGNSADTITVTGTGLSNVVAVHSAGTYQLNGGEQGSLCSTSH